MSTGYHPLGEYIRKNLKIKIIIRILNLPKIVEVILRFTRESTGYGLENRLRLR